ncbi:MAG: ATP-dependent zinc metalloprotease FtsH [Phycisphaeraceae bacterium]
MAGPNEPQKEGPERPRKPGQTGPGRGGAPRGPQNFLSRGALGWIILGGLAIALLIMVKAQGNTAKDITWQEFMNYATHGDFEGHVVVKEDRITGTLKEGTPGVESTGASEKAKRLVSVKIIGASDFYLNKLSEAHVDFVSETNNSILYPLLFTWAPFIVVILLIYFFVFRTIRNAGGGPGMLGSFGRSRHKVANKEHSNVSLSDVAGIEEAKDEVGEIIEFLKNPKKFQRLGGRVPRGVLLIGEPGCGKTLLAKAVAGEADVPFFSISGSDFVEMFVGVGASRVRDLFRQAKESSPCIVFLDEIDAVGRKRGSGFTSGGHDEREQTLNAILVEMDGFDTNDQIIVMAATNRSDVLDPALTRPGRFDRQIHVPLPDVRGRMEILKVHSRRIKMSPNVNMEKLARGTPMFSGADLAAIINEAAIAATLSGKDWVEQDDLEEARDKVKWGRARKSHKVEEEERVATAYHEAGHAVLQKLLPHADPLHKVTIIPRGQAMGATISLPEKDRYGYAMRYLGATMRLLCGGRIAEQMKTGDVSSGAAMDIRMATTYARHMIIEWGMSEKVGFINLSEDKQRESLVTMKDYSDATARLIDEEIKRLIDEAYADAKRMIEENWDKVTAIAEALLKFETLSAEEVDRLMKGETLDKPTVGDLLKAEQQKSKAASKAAAAAGNHEADTGGAIPHPA